MSKVIKDERGQQIELDCTIQGPDGQKYEAGGSFVYLHEDGLLRASLYAFNDGHIVGTWDGKEKVRVFHRNAPYRSNMGDTRVSVWFTWNGVDYAGTYYQSSSDIVRAKQIKPQGKKEN